MSGPTIFFTNCCAHKHSISYSFKLQFYAHPEDRWYPNYRNPRTTTSTSTSTETLLNAESRLPVSDARTQIDESTHSNAASSSVAVSPRLPDRPSTPAATEHADSRPTTPRQLLGDGFSVVPGPSRRLQRERPFSVAPDPMWNSSREIRPYERLATHAPPPPYVLPPTYAETDPPGQIEPVEEVVIPEPYPVETIEIEPSTLQPPTLGVRNVSVSSTVIPRVPVDEEEVHDKPSYTFGPSWNFSSIAPQVEISTTSENETGDVDVGSELSEKARGKKRMREEDYSLDEKDDSEVLEHLGEGCSGGNTRNGQPDRKRVKTETDTRISTDPLEVDTTVLIVARHGIFETLTDVQSWFQVKKLKEIEKLHRAGRHLLA